MNKIALLITKKYFNWNLIELYKLNQNQIFYVAVDEGYLAFENQQIKPDIVIGDFDSIDEDKIENANKVFKNTQNFSDSEYACIYLKKFNFHQIWIYNDGPRWDHFFANILLVKKYNVTLFNEKNLLFSFKNVSLLNNYQDVFQYFSLFCFKSTNIKLLNCKYEIKDFLKLNDDSAIGLSNEFLKNQNVDLVCDDKIYIFLSNN